MPPVGEAPDEDRPSPRPSQRTAANQRRIHQGRREGWKEPR